MAYHNPAAPCSIRRLLFLPCSVHPSFPCPASSGRTHWFPVITHHKIFFLLPEYHLLYPAASDCRSGTPADCQQSSSDILCRDALPVSDRYDQQPVPDTRAQHDGIFPRLPWCSSFSAYGSSQAGYSHHSQAFCPSYHAVLSVHHKDGRDHPDDLYTTVLLLSMRPDVLHHRRCF